MASAGARAYNGGQGAEPPPGVQGQNSPGGGQGVEGPWSRRNFQRICYSFCTKWCIVWVASFNLMLHIFLFNVAQPAFKNTHFV